MSVVEAAGLRYFVLAAGAENRLTFHILDVSEVSQLIICGINWVCSQA